MSTAQTVVGLAYIAFSILYMSGVISKPGGGLVLPHIRPKRGRGMGR